MARLLKIIVTIVCVAAVFSGTAAHAATSLAPGLLIGDQDGIRVNRDGDYYINAVGLMPGDVITKTLTIHNTERDIPFRLFMTAEPLQHSGPIDLQDKVKLDLNLDGRQIYHGRIRGDAGVNMTLNALELGRFAHGDQRVLTATLTVDADMKVFPEKSEADIKWHFYAVKEEAGDPPKTGEDAPLYLLLFSAALTVGAVALTIARKAHEKE
jgi:hypothetical protein